MGREHTAAYLMNARRRKRRRASSHGDGFTSFKAGHFNDGVDDYIGFDTTEPYGSLGGQPLEGVAELLAVFYDTVDDILYIVFDGEVEALEDYDIYLDGVQITPTWDISAGTSEASFAGVALRNGAAYRLEFR